MWGGRLRELLLSSPSDDTSTHQGGAVTFGFCARGAPSTFAALSLFVLFAVGGCGSSDKKPAATPQASSASTSATSNSTSSATSTTAPSAATLEITVARGQVV